MTHLLKKPILVTGGAGYIGAHVCKMLATYGALPITYDNLSEGHSYAVKWGPFLKGDIRDRKTLDLAFETYKPEAVMHFAANALVSESVSDPGKYYSNNVSGTLTLLEAMRDHGVYYFIFSSTCATYGVPTITPITEEHIQAPINPYGRSKLMIEQILKDFKKAYGIYSISLRYFNAAGADREGHIGENHFHETHLIPLVIQTAQKVHPHIKIYGNDFKTKDGTAIRDYIHVEDLADAHVRSLDWLLENKKNDCFNLGTGLGYSVKDIIDAVEKFSGEKVAVEITDRRLGDPPILVADSRKAQHLLNWEAKNSHLSTIIESAWNWHKTLDSKSQ